MALRSSGGGVRVIHPHEEPKHGWSIHAIEDYHESTHGPLPAFYDTLIARAVLAEALGYESFWITEHHFLQNVEVSRATDFYQPQGNDVVLRYRTDFADLG